MWESKMENQWTDQVASTYCYQYITLIEIISNGHDIFEKILQLHFGQGQDYVAELCTIVDLFL
jgi:hypothetical protein